MEKVIRILGISDRVDASEWVAIYTRCVQCTHLDFAADDLAAPSDMDPTWHAFNGLLERILGDEAKIERLLESILRYCGATTNSSAISQGLSPSQLHAFRSLLDFSLLRNAKFSRIFSQDLVVSEVLWRVIEKKFDFSSPGVLHAATIHSEDHHAEALFHSHLMLYLSKLLRAIAEEVRILKRMRKDLSLLLRVGILDGASLAETPSTLSAALVDTDEVRESVQRKICRMWNTELLHEMIAGIYSFINTSIKGKDTRALKQGAIKTVASCFGGIVTLASLQDFVALAYPNNKRLVDPKALERFLLASNVIDEFGIVRVNPLDTTHGKQKLNTKKFKVDEGPLEKFLAEVHGNTGCVLECLVGPVAEVGTTHVVTPSVLPLEVLVCSWMEKGGIGAAILDHLPQHDEKFVQAQLSRILAESVVRVCKLCECEGGGAPTSPSSSSPTLAGSHGADLILHEFSALLETSRVLLARFTEIAAGTDINEVLLALEELEATVVNSSREILL